MCNFKDYSIIKQMNGTDYNYFVLKKNGVRYFAKVLIKNAIEYKNKLNNEIKINELLKDYHFLPCMREYSIQDNNSYIIYDYINGKTLNSYKDLDNYIIIDILIIIASYLEKLHSKNIIHCDIKPENIMIDKDGNVFIIDFENASFIGSRVYFGTKRYCSIDQLKGGNVNIQFDIYAFGIMMYEMLTRDFSYKDLDDEELINRKMNYNFSINKINKNISKLADKILFRALGFDNNYYASFSEIKKDLYLLKTEQSKFMK